MGNASSFRWTRFIDAVSRTGLIVPLDHGLTGGPISGIGHMTQVLPWLRSRLINGVIVHKGFAARLHEANALEGKGLCVHLNGAMTLSRFPERKELLVDVDTVLRLGADAVSIDLVFDGSNDTENLRLASHVSDAARVWQLPLLVMLKSTKSDAGSQARIFRHLTRAMTELGATAVKVPRCQASDIGELLDDVSRDIDVFFAGGERDDEQSLIDFAAQAVQAGARGFCFGRNVFQNPRPEAFMAKLRLVMDREVPKGVKAVV